MSARDLLRTCQPDLLARRPDLLDLLVRTNAVTCDDDRSNRSNRFSDLAAHTRSIGTGRGNAQDGAHAQVRVNPLDLSAPEEQQP
jgi:hypothetical protein